MQNQNRLHRAFDFFGELVREHPQILLGLVSAVAAVVAMAFFGFLIGSMADHAATLAQ